MDDELIEIEKEQDEDQPLIRPADLKEILYDLSAETAFMSQAMFALGLLNGQKLALTDHEAHGALLIGNRISDKLLCLSERV